VRERGKGFNGFLISDRGVGGLAATGEKSLSQGRLFRKGDLLCASPVLKMVETGGIPEISGSKDGKRRRGAFQYRG